MAGTTGQPAGPRSPSTPRARRLSSRAVEAARTPNACQACRDKKVKCSGQQPCKYCEKRCLECVFNSSDRRRLFSISQIRKLQDKIAFYEQHAGRDTSPQSSIPAPVADDACAGPSQDEQHDQGSGSTPAPAINADQQNLSPGAQTADCRPPGPPLRPQRSQRPQRLQRPQRSQATQSSQQPQEHPRLQSSQHQQSLSPGWQTAPVGSTASSRPNLGPSIVPASALSSSETFGSEVRTLLVSRSNPGSTGASSAIGADPSPLIIRESRRRPDLDSDLNLDTDAVQGWPSEEEAHTMLDLVVLNVGVSQHMFDARRFSDNLSMLYQDGPANVQLSELCVTQMLLVLAIGRLLLARPDDNGDLPGTGFFREAMRSMPTMPQLRQQGILGVEVVGLVAMYLQIADRKDDAYLYANMSLRLAISNGFHRAGDSGTRQRPAVVHQNRLWWSLYMQERRLCATGGYPMSIGDYAITTPAPYDAAGYPSATAMAVNVQTARVTGQITSTIYAHRDETEAAFVTSVQHILRSLHDIETGMPSEFSIKFSSDGLLVAGLSFAETSPITARTSSSLYMSVYSAIIHTVRPILLHMARHSRDAQSGSQGQGQQSHVSPVLRRLAEICVEASSKTLLLLQQLRSRDLVARHSFLDLDAAFSTGFIFVLVEAINPGQGLGVDGIQGARAILGQQVLMGNQAAAKRLQELEQMCESLSLPVQHDPPTSVPLPSGPLDFATTGALTQPFSFYGGHGASNSDYPVTGTSDVDHRTQRHEDGPDQFCGGHAPGDAGYVQPGLDSVDLSTIPLEGENSLYWVYHDPGLPFTGVEQTDWEALESQLL